MTSKVLKVQNYPIKIKLFYDEEDGWGGSMDSELVNPEDPPAVQLATQAIESMVLAHACEGIDISTPEYSRGLDTAFGHIADNWE